MEIERDPYGKSQHESGAKLDAEKNRLGLVLHGFAKGLEEVGKVGTYGAKKYTPNGWKTVDDGFSRYTDAMYRHLLAEARGEFLDRETHLVHAAHVAWNALARLTLLIDEREGKLIAVESQLGRAVVASQPAAYTNGFYGVQDTPK